MSDWPFRATDRDISKTFQQTLTRKCFDLKTIKSAALIRSPVDRRLTDRQTFRPAQSVHLTCRSAQSRSSQASCDPEPLTRFTWKNLEEPGRTWRTSSGFYHNILVTRQQKLQTASHRTQFGGWVSGAGNSFTKVAVFCEEEKLHYSDGAFGQTWCLKLRWVIHKTE